MAICPFAKQYQRLTEVVVTENWEQRLDHVCQLLHPLKLEAVVIGGPMRDYDSMTKMVKKFEKKYKRRDVEILLMHPDTEEPPLPLEYNFKYSPLIIVQRLSTLEKSRRILEKNGKYYKYYK